MSATNRGERGGGGFDYFATPPHCVDRLLKYCEIPGGHWLEPSAGDGAIIRAVNARRKDVSWTAVELRIEGGYAIRQSDPTANVWTSDFLRLEIDDVLRELTEGTRLPVCIGNPPYSDAARFISKGLELADRVIFLLRLNFLETQERMPFFRRVGMPDVYVFPDRPSFTGGGTDATAYGWMEWRREWAGRNLGKLVMMYPDDVVNQEEMFSEAV